MALDIILKVLEGEELPNIGETLEYPGKIWSPFGVIANPTEGILWPMYELGSIIIDATNVNDERIWGNFF